MNRILTSLRNHALWAFPLTAALIVVATAVVLAGTTGHGQANVSSDDEFAADKEARALAEPDYSTTVFSSAADAHPREHSLFLDKDGFIEVTAYDDRHLTDEQKLEDPLVNPNWEPFAECVADHGLEVRADPANPYTQADLDRLIEIVNEEGPFEAATPQGLVYHGTLNSDAFLQCAEGYLR